MIFQALLLFGGIVVEWYIPCYCWLWHYIVIDIDYWHCYCQYWYCWWWLCCCDYTIRRDGDYLPVGIVIVVIVTVAGKFWWLFWPDWPVTVTWLIVVTVVERWLRAHCILLIPTVTVRSFTRCLVLLMYGYSATLTIYVHSFYWFVTIPLIDCYIVDLRILTLIRYRRCCSGGCSIRCRPVALLHAFILLDPSFSHDAIPTTTLPTTHARAYTYIYPTSTHLTSPALPWPRYLLMTFRYCWPIVIVGGIVIHGNCYLITVFIPVYLFTVVYSHLLTVNVMTDLPIAIIPLHLLNVVPWVLDTCCYPFYGDPTFIHYCWWRRDYELISRWWLTVFSSVDVVTVA